MSQGTAGKGRPQGAAFVIAALLAALGGVILWDSLGLPPPNQYSGIGPGTVPKLIGWGLIGLSVWTVIEGIRGDIPMPEDQEPLPVLMILAGLLALIFLLPYIGFSPAMALLFAASAAAFGKRNLLITLPVGLVFAFLLYGLFDQLLQLNLPAGWLEKMTYGS